MHKDIKLSQIYQVLLSTQMEHNCLCSKHLIIDSLA